MTTDPLTTALDATLADFIVERVRAELKISELRTQSLLPLLLAAPLTVALLCIAPFSQEPLCRIDEFFVGMSLSEANRVVPGIDPKRDRGHLEVWSSGEQLLYFRQNVVVRIVGKQAVVGGVRLGPSASLDRCLEDFRCLDENGTISSWNWTSDESGGALISAWNSREVLELYFRDRKLWYTTLELQTGRCQPATLGKPINL